jgi:putative addiction module killer protein
MTEFVEVRHYINAAGRDIFDEWLSKLTDLRAQAKVAVRIDRLAAGNFGDSRSLGQGLHELRIDWGPGYRVYYATVAKRCILLLGGSDKRKQASEIEKSIARLHDYSRRSEKR